MRIFIGLVEIAGYYRGLKSGFDQLGVKSDFYNLFYHPFHFDKVEQNNFIRLIQFFDKKRLETPRYNKIGRMCWIFLMGLLRIPLFIWVLSRYDVFIFGFNSSFFYFIDIPILKFFGKKIIYQFHGSDSRPPYLNGALMTGANKLNIKECIKESKRKKKIIETIEKYADIIIDIPPQGHFHKRSFINWLRIGIPVKPILAGQIYNSDSNVAEDNNSVRILHAPSHPEAKGSFIIQKTIEKLKEKGYKIDFIQITGQPNAIVQEELKSCDFVIDQLYADYGMPGFATEAAWFGKPVIIGGYARELWEELLPPEKCPPTLYCHPDELEQAIEHLITDKTYRIELGKKARSFVENEWNPSMVAGRYMRLIQGDIPMDWVYDPVNIDYILGACLPQEKVRDIVEEIVRIDGIEALQLSDKPKLENKFKEFIQR